MGNTEKPLVSDRRLLLCPHRRPSPAPLFNSATPARESTRRSLVARDLRSHGSIFFPPRSAISGLPLIPVPLLAAFGSPGKEQRDLASGPTAYRPFVLSSMELTFSATWRSMPPNRRVRSPLEGFPADSSPSGSVYRMICRAPGGFRPGMLFLAWVCP